MSQDRTLDKNAMVKLNLKKLQFKDREINQMI